MNNVISEMPIFNDRLKAFVALGQHLHALLDGEAPPNNNWQAIYEAFTPLITQVHRRNAWFTPEMTRHALRTIANSLNEQSLNNWLAAYPDLNKQQNSKLIGVVMAGNIPAVGFHDMLTVLMAGHRLLAKLSSKDNLLLPYLARIVSKTNKQLSPHITFTESHLQNFDAIIATGSNNTQRYFKQYFSPYPHIIRHNRNSAAILTGRETPEQLRKLADDCLLYFGLGCRSVSKLYVPEGYDITQIFNAFEAYDYLKEHHKYSNNYDYHRSLYLLNRQQHLDNGFLILRETSSLNSPISVLHYEQYERPEDVLKQLTAEVNNLQCVVCTEVLNQKLPFVLPGQSQLPALSDYADGIDSLHFLLQLNSSK